MLLSKCFDAQCCVSLPLLMQALFIIIIIIITITIIIKFHFAKHERSDTIKFTMMKKVVRG